MSNSVQPVDPTTKLDLTMEAQEWNMIVEILAKSRGFAYVETAPLIEKLSEQMKRKAERVSSVARLPNTGTNA